MKYTDYILSERPYHPEGLVALPTVIIAVPVLIGFLAAAILMDRGRYMKLRYLLRQRELRQEAYIKCILRSLDRKETRENIEMLKAL